MDLRPREWLRVHVVNREGRGLVMLEPLGMEKPIRRGRRPVKAKAKGPALTPME